MQLLRDGRVQGRYTPVRAHQRVGSARQWLPPLFHIPQVLHHHDLPSIGQLLSPLTGLGLRIQPRILPEACWSRWEGWWERSLYKLDGASFSTGWGVTCRREHPQDHFIHHAAILSTLHPRATPQAQCLLPLKRSPQDIGLRSAHQAYSQAKRNKEKDSRVIQEEL